jgi:rRNA small subunit pseudouridine methyltransferase Nep1
LALRTEQQKQEPFVVCIGAISRGEITPDFTEEKLAISAYPLSAALCCAKVTSAFEKYWGVL